MKRILRFCDYFFIGFSYLASKKIIAILIVILFVELLKTSFGYQGEFLTNEQDIFYEKRNPNINYYYDSRNFNDANDNIAVLELVQCYQKELQENEITEELKRHIDELKLLFDEDEAYFSFLYKDLYSGFTISYNEDASIFTASTIKAPAMIYLYEMASRGEVNLEEKLVYTQNFYSEGSGVLKTKPVNTSYPVGQLIEYAIHDSDNIAYAMLMNRFGRENILNFWNDLGTKYIFTNNTIWGVTSARDAAIYMEELYRFSKENKEYGNKLLDYFKNAEWKLITDKDGNFNTANKGGWSNQAIHDVAIVFEENPYILIVMSNKGEGGYSSLFKQTSEKVGMLHDEYWKYKSNVCGKIALY